MSFDYSVGNLNEVRMGHKMTHINGRVAAIGGYDSRYRVCTNILQGVVVLECTLYSAAESNKP